MEDLINQTYDKSPSRPVPLLAEKESYDSQYQKYLREEHMEEKASEKSDRY